MPPHLKKRKGRSSWYLLDGLKRISLNTSRRGYAEILLQEYIRKDLGIYQTPKKRVSAFRDSYLNYYKTLNKVTTLDDKQRVLRFFIEQSGDPFIAKVNDKTIHGFLAFRKEKGLSSERWNTERQVLSNFFRYLIDKEKIPIKNPCKEVDKQKVVKGKIPKSLSEEQEVQLLDHLIETDLELYRMAVIAGNTALRVREMVNLTWPDINWKAKELYVRAKEDWTPKDWEERAIPLNQQADSFLRIQKKENLIGLYVFPRKDGKKYGRGLDVRMERAFKKAGLMPGGGFHALRHTYATRAVESGMDLETLRKIMGHSDTKTLMKYTHVSTEHVRRMSERVRFGTVSPKSARRGRH